MDAEKLNEALMRAWCEYRGMEYVGGYVNPLPSENFNAGFMRGFNWLMQQPLADRLSDEEKEKIKIKYAELLKAQRKARQDRDTFYGNILSAQRGIYESIFGKELFNEK